jgi:class 3 adenylate cyclase
VAEAGEVVAAIPVATSAGIEAQPLGQRRLKGFDDGIELCRLLGDAYHAAHGCR